MENSFLDVLEYENLNPDEPQVLNKYVTHVTLVFVWQLIINAELADYNNVCLCFQYVVYIIQHQYCQIMLAV